MGKASRKKQSKPQVATRPPGLPAMSAALIDLVEPLREDDMSLAQYQTLMTIGLFAWNLALYPKAERKGQMQAFFKSNPGFELSFNEIVALGSDEEVREEPSRGMNLIMAIKALIHRKERLFPDDNRLAVNVEVSWKNEDFHVSAASQLSLDSPGEPAGA